MPAIGIARFRKMLEQLLEKSHEDGVEWGYDLTEKCYCACFESDAEISVYRHSPANEPAIAGAVLHVREQLVITLEAEENEDDWPLLNELYQCAESIANSDSAAIEAIERQLASGELLGFAETGGRTSQARDPGWHSAKVGAMAEKSPDDLVDGDSPFDQQ